MNSVKVGETPMFLMPILSMVNLEIYIHAQNLVFFNMVIHSLSSLLKLFKKKNLFQVSNFGN